MGDLLRRGLSMMHAVRKASMAQEVVYVHGNERITLSATIGRTVYDEVDESGVVSRYEARDFLVDESDLEDANGLSFQPSDGDRIEYADMGGRTGVYEVMPHGNEPATRRSDPFSAVIRIHTKLTGYAD